MAAKRFGKFELIRSLGHGGMAEAWLAQSKGAAGVVKPVVLKKVLPELAVQNELVESFIAEARISATLSHGNIAQVFEFGEVDGEYYLAMEWVNGKSLAHAMSRAQKKGYWHLPIPVAAYIAAESLKGLHHAHTRRGADGQPLHLVHRDATPDNILLSFEGEVKVADFGIAKARLAGRKQTQVGVVKGKFLYFSPEQARGREVDARTDVYAIGATLYQMLTGRLAFEGPYMDVMPKLVAGQYTPVRELNPEVPEELEAIVDRAMAKDVAERYRSAQQMLEALTSFLSENAPSFSAERLKLLLDFLYEDEHRAEGEPRTFSEAERDQLAAWKPERSVAAPRARSDSTMAELEPVKTGESAVPSRSLRLIAVAVLVVLLVIVGGVAVQLMVAQPPRPTGPSEPVAIKLPPKPIEPKPVEPKPIEAPAKPIAEVPAFDENHRVLKLSADTHQVKRRPAKTQSRTLDWPSVRVSFVDIANQFSNVKLEFQDASGAVQVVPITAGETLVVKAKKNLGVVCEMGPIVDPSAKKSFFVLDPGSTRTRLQVDPMLCTDFEAAKRVELDYEKSYTLSLPKDASVKLGTDPVLVTWRARTKDGTFAAGSLKPGAQMVLTNALFLEVGFLVSSESGNEGSLEAKLDADVAAGRNAAGSVGREATDKQLTPMTYAESMKLPSVQKANVLLNQGRSAEVLAEVRKCMKEPRPVPECFRLEGEAYIRLDERETGLTSYRKFVELAGDDHPSKRAIVKYLKGAE